MTSNSRLFDFLQKAGSALRKLSAAFSLICLAQPVLADERYTLPNGQEVVPLETFQECDICPEMIFLPMSSFIMGAPLAQSAFLYSLWNKPNSNEPAGLRQEGPEHKVVIDIPIAMGRYEVTRSEWMACVAERGCAHMPDPRIPKFGGGYYVSDGARDPIFDVSYLDMLEYVAWLNRRVGEDVYRLPTEAEWEYAARAGTQTKFAQGDSLTTDQANIALFRWEGDRSVEEPGNRRTPVPVDNLDAANPWGLRHMAGNLLEQTMSCWSERHLGLPTTSAYLMAAGHEKSCRRVCKGGSFGRSEEYARPANRGQSKETSRSDRVGFRIVREM